MVTVTIGGNDVGFAGLVAACVISDCSLKEGLDYVGPVLSAMSGACKDFNGLVDLISVPLDALEKASFVNDLFSIDEAADGAFKALGPIEKADTLCKIYGFVADSLGFDRELQSTRFVESVLGARLDNVYTDVLYYAAR